MVSSTNDSLFDQYCKKAGVLFAELFVEIRVKCIEILAVQTILYQPEAFTEALVMNDFALAKIFDRITYFRIFYQTQDVVIGQAGFLLCCHIFMHICNRIARRLDHRCTPGLSGSRLRPQADCMVDIIGGKSLLFKFFCCEIPGKLVNNGTDHFHVCQFFCTCIGKEIAPEGDAYPAT